MNATPLPTTITGSLNRPQQLEALTQARDHGQPVDPDAWETAVSDAVRHAVRLQQEAGITIVGDGEMGRSSFMDASSRMTGFGGDPWPYYPWDVADDPDHGGPAVGTYLQETAIHTLPSNNGPITYTPAAIKAVIKRFRDAFGGVFPPGRAFLSSPAPGLLHRLGTSHYKSDQAFLDALGAAQHEEWLLIADAGLAVQADHPDLLMGRHTDFRGRTLREFRAIARDHVAVTNAAFEGIPLEQRRAHACWGNYPWGHGRDVPLAAMLDILCQLEVGTLLIEQANSQHHWEIDVLAERIDDLPPHLTFGIGVIDTKTVVAEHPMTVAKSLVEAADKLGPDRVIGTLDCGLGTFGGAPNVPMDIGRQKIGALGQGAQIAADRLAGSRLVSAAS
jgi:5-methyltetrahydropteroyltriglutamate--homocysteine methyltransferase